MNSNKIKIAGILYMDKSELIMKIFLNKTKQTIYCYLLIYNELTLDQISDLLQKSKSTIHHHMQHLLEAGLIYEQTRSGSKTIYYKLTLIRLDEESKKIYNYNVIKKQSEKKQITRLKEFIKFCRTLTFIMQNLIKLNHERYRQIINDVENQSTSISNSFEKMRDSLLTVFFACEENASSFKEELKNLINKYYLIEVANPDKIRPYSFVLLGLNVKDILDRKILVEKDKLNNTDIM